MRKAAFKAAFGVDEGGNEAGLIWQHYKSIEAAREFARGFVGDKEREFAKAPACVHYLLTANWIYNWFNTDKVLKEKLEAVGLPLEVVVFAAYCHDLCEDFAGLTPEIIVEKCWKGDIRHKKGIIHILTRLNDPKTLSGKQRLAEQVRVANDPDDQLGYLISTIRAADKIVTAEEDLKRLQEMKAHFRFHLIAGNLKAKGITQAAEMVCRRNRPLIHRLRYVPRKHKAYFTQLNEDIGNTASEILIRKTAVMDRIEPLLIIGRSLRKFVKAGTNSSNSSFDHYFL